MPYANLFGCWCYKGKNIFWDFLKQIFDIHKQDKTNLDIYQKLHYISLLLLFYILDISYFFFFLHKVYLVFLISRVKNFAFVLITQLPAFLILLINSRLFCKLSHRQKNLTISRNLSLYLVEYLLLPFSEFHL